MWNVYKTGGEIGRDSVMFGVPELGLIWNPHGNVIMYVSAP